MMKQQTVVETAFQNRALKLVTISEVITNYHTGKSQINVICRKHPVACAVITRRGAQAFSTDGTEIDIAELAQLFPELQSLMKKTKS